jgi:adenine phosphoribosyltransferase
MIDNMVKEITLDFIKEQIRTVPDFPKRGVQFKDITTILKQRESFAFVVDSIADRFTGLGITKVVCIESRGFIVGGALAIKIGAGFVPIRKPGKLPAATHSIRYDLEYGTDSIEIHKDALTSGDIILLHDDLLATGGTARAAIKLIGISDPKKIYLSFLCELDFLHGRDALKNYPIHSLIHL